MSAVARNACPHGHLLIPNSKGFCSLWSLYCQPAKKHIFWGQFMTLPMRETQPHMVHGTWTVNVQRFPGPYINLLFITYVEGAIALN